jgi:hypothetical protein
MLRISLGIMELAIAIAANVVIGVVLLALFAWYRTPDAVRLTGPEEALAIFRRHFPDAAGTVTVDAYGVTALIALHHELKFGLIHRHGRRWNAREIHAEELRSVTVDGPTITLALTDFGWPRTHVRIADLGTRDAWLSRLHAFAAKRHDGHSTVTPHA